MNDKELYQQKKQAQLNEWKAGMLLFRIKALAARAHSQLELSKHVKLLENKLDEGKIKLAELTKTTGSSFEPMKKNFEVTWESIITTLSDTSAKFEAIA